MDALYQSALVRLKESIAEANAISELRDAEFLLIAGKMTAFQLGDGPAPTVEDFIKWRSHVEGRNRLRDMQK